MISPFHTLMKTQDSWLKGIEPTVFVTRIVCLVVFIPRGRNLSGNLSYPARKYSMTLNFCFLWKGRRWELSMGSGMANFRSTKFIEQNWKTLKRKTKNWQHHAQKYSRSLKSYQTPTFTQALISKPHKPTVPPKHLT